MAHPKSGYRNAAGERIPGTTTIIGRFKDSGGLLWWAFQQGEACERGEVTGLYDKRDEAADSGTLAHEMVEMHIKGSEFKAPENAPEKVLTQAENAYLMYLEWADQSKLEIIEQEMNLVSEEYQFGGTPDAIGMIKGELCLVDWKTSNGVYPDYLIQLAAYRHLWEENHPDKPITGGFHLCRFAKERGDFAHHYFAELDDAWDQFKLFRESYEIDKRLKKRV